MQYATSRVQTRTKMTAGAIKGHVDNTSQPGEGGKKEVFLQKSDRTAAARTINMHVKAYVA